VPRTIAAVLVGALLALAACATRPTVHLDGEYRTSSGFVECNTGRHYDLVFPDTLTFRFDRALRERAQPGQAVRVELSGYLSESSSEHGRLYVMGFGTIVTGDCAD
jgi:hypothetical protein